MWPTSILTFNVLWVSWIKGLVTITYRVCNVSFFSCVSPCVNEFKLQNYLRQPLDVRYLKEITKIRICAHKINLEFGRHRNVERSERKCTFCNLNEIEDEYHFILQCPLYNEIRMKFIKAYYRKRPSVFKLTQLLNNKELSNLGQHWLKANAFRDRLLERNG